jgi:hypothetical protein
MPNSEHTFDMFPALRLYVSMKFFYISVRVFDFFVLLFIIYALRLLEKNSLPIIYTYVTRSVQRRKAA